MIAKIVTIFKCLTVYLVQVSANLSADMKTLRRCNRAEENKSRCGKNYFFMVLFFVIKPIPCAIYKPNNE